jgi:ABC-type Zn uptake system ZnuABC Zn-binding protein ZnuA
MKKIIRHLTICIALCVAFSGNLLAKKLNVVTSLPDLASIADEVGGEYVNTFAIAVGYQDPHFVDAKPSFIIKLKSADMFVQMGLDLEIGWVPQLLEGARNPQIMPGGKGYVDASIGVPLLQVPTADPATLRAQGDIHIYGNPHFWLDPENGKIIAKNICDGLIRLMPENREVFLQNLAAFQQKIDQKLTEWHQKAAILKGEKVIAYHNSWPYFEKQFGFQIANFVEPKPGIPPSPKHLVGLIKQIKREKIELIIIEPYYSKKSCEMIAERTGAIVVELATSVGAFPQIKTYFDLFDFNIEQMVTAYRQYHSVNETGGISQ